MLLPRKMVFFVGRGYFKDHGKYNLGRVPTPGWGMGILIFSTYVEH
jgi:hypothetical protein